MRSRERLVASALLALAAATAACARSHAGETAPAEGPATIIFENQSTAQASVYAVPQNGFEQRIGTVFAGRTDTLTISESILGGGTVTIAARLLARSETPSTGPLTLERGSLLSVTLPPSANTLIVLPAEP